jgi:hypothetical protein
MQTDIRIDKRRLPSLQQVFPEVEENRNAPDHIIIQARAYPCRPGAVSKTIQYLQLQRGAHLPFHQPGLRRREKSWYLPFDRILLGYCHRANEAANDQDNSLLSHTFYFEMLILLISRMFERFE